MASKELEEGFKDLKKLGELSPNTIILNEEMYQKAVDSLHPMFRGKIEDVILKLDFKNKYVRARCLKW